jgi:hypothetical protein
MCDNPKPKDVPSVGDSAPHGERRPVERTGSRFAVADMTRIAVNLRRLEARLRRIEKPGGDRTGSPFRC